MNIHMIGIGGIGMSALAQLFVSRGDTVSGSDRGESPTTNLLKEKGVEIFIGQHAENVPNDADMVVYSDAIPEDNSERMRVVELGIRQVSYFEALGEVSTDMKTIAVAGTHGKTTTTALLTKILKDAGESPTAIIGSLVPEFGSNFVEGRDTFVVEACEYHDHLLQLDPKILVITNLEWDHTDWFPTFEAMQETFKKAIEKVPEDGAIVTDPKNPGIKALLTDARAKIIDYTSESVPELKLIGEFNKENARAAKAAAKVHASELSEEVIDKSLTAFTGTWRRFEFIGETSEGAFVYDDYAHHPTAVKKTLKAVHESFGDKKLIVAFHPHLYTRTHDFMDEFAGSFDEADCVLVAPIYAAREEPIPGVTNSTLSEKIKAKGTDSIAPQSFDEIERVLKEKYNKPNNIILTMGAGDIVKVAHRLVQK